MIIWYLWSVFLGVVQSGVKRGQTRGSVNQENDFFLFSLFFSGDERFAMFSISLFFSLSG